MKNLMIYISPTGSFDNPREDLAANDASDNVQIQIENSTQLGWENDDIVLCTNFDYEYRDIHSINLENVDFFNRKPQVSKISAIIKMFENGLVDSSELYWFHDLDAFQTNPFSEQDLDIGYDEIGVTQYGGVRYAGLPRLSTGVIFFRGGSKDIFEQVKRIAYDRNIDEEEALMILMTRDMHIAARVKILNHTYNFIGYNLLHTFQHTDKPIKVVHFHPTAGKRRLNTDNAYRYFRGENPMNLNFIPERLITIFKWHGIR